MKTWLLIVVAVAGCKGGSKSQPSAAANPDCELIKKTPMTAVAELSKKYPNNAAKVAQTIEDCVAPPGAGDECERVAAIVKAIPTMAPGLAMPNGSNTDYAATCRMSPPELRRCFMPSYALAHDVECKKLRDQVSAQVDLPVKPANCDGGSIDLVVTSEGVWVVTGKDPASRCFSKRTGAGLDHAWLEKELAQWNTRDCRPSVAIAADKDVRYQDEISAMDIAVKVGLLETTISTVDELGVTFKTGEEAKAPQHCPTTTIPNSTAPSAAGPGSGALAGHAPTATGSDGLVKAPVIIVTKDAISIGNPGGSGASADVMSVKDAAGGSGVIDDLKRALPLPGGGDTIIILQADQDTPAGVVARIVQTAKAAGFDNVLFAVKNK